MKPRTKNRSRESERLKRKQLLPLKYRYSERRKRVYVAASIKIPAASNRTRHLWPPSCLLLRARACEKTWVQEKPSTNQTKVSFVVIAFTIKHCDKILNMVKKQVKGLARMESS